MFNYNYKPPTGSDGTVGWLPTVSVVSVCFANMFNYNYKSPAGPDGTVGYPLSVWYQFVLSIRLTTITNLLLGLMVQ